MPTTDQQRRAIAFLVRTHRTSVYGANDWDEAGILAALNKVRGIDCAMVTVAAMRAAADASLKTPAKIADTTTAIYAERVGPEVARRHPKPEDACHTCGQELTDKCCDRPTRKPDPSDDYTGQAERARSLLRVAERTRPTPEDRPVVRDPRAEQARAELHDHTHPAAKEATL